MHKDEVVELSEAEQGRPPLSRWLTLALTYSVPHNPSVDPLWPLFSFSRGETDNFTQQCQREDVAFQNNYTSVSWDSDALFI